MEFVGWSATANAFVIVTYYSVVFAWVLMMIFGALKFVGMTGDSEAASGAALAVGALMFTLQIYCDFSGYSDIAIGTARLFGINLSRNFDFPYFARNVSEFWRNLPKRHLPPGHNYRPPPFS